jgi:hypothetical protein
MYINSNTSGSHLRVSSILGGSYDTKNLIRSGKKRGNKKQKNGVVLSINRKASEENLDSDVLEKSKLNYGPSNF